MSLALKQNALKRLIEDSKKAVLELQDVEPLIASHDGTMLSADGRVALKFLCGTDPIRGLRDHYLDLAEKGEAPRGAGTPGLNRNEAFALMSRLAAMPQLEEIALTAQRDAAILRKALLPIYNALSKGQQPTPKEVVAAAQALRETE